MIPIDSLVTAGSTSPRTVIPRFFDDAGGSGTSDAVAPLVEPLSVLCEESVVLRTLRVERSNGALPRESREVAPRSPEEQLGVIDRLL